MAPCAQLVELSAQVRAREGEILSATSSRRPGQIAWRAPSKLLAILCAACGLALAGAALAQVSPGFDLRWSMISSGGGPRASTEYRLADSLGQWDGRALTSAGYRIEPGFWPGAAVEPRCGQPLTGVSLQGAAEGRVGLPHAFVAVTAPPEASAPLIYTWSPEPASGQGGLGATYEWPAAGAYSVTLTVRNCGGSVSAAATVVVKAADATRGDGYEADDDCAQARPITVDGQAQEHSFHAPGDTDWARFEAASGARYQVEAQTGPTAPTDVKLELYDACAGPPRQSFDATFTPGVRLEFQAPADGPLFLRLSNYDSAVAGPDVTYRVAVRRLQEPAAAQGAVILVAGRLRAGDHLQPNIEHVVSTAYTVFKQQGYDDAMIELLASNPALAGYDRPATAANLRDAITVWAAARVGPGRPLTLLLMDHGESDLFFVDDVGQQRLRPDELDAWLAELEQAVPGVRITIVVEACQSGSFIEGVLSASGPSRVVIASTNATAVAYASADGAQFADQFLGQLSQGYGLCQSFQSAKDAVRAVYLLQEPWIDGNGNRQPNEASDCAEANSLTPARSREADDSWAPYILQVVHPARAVAGRASLYVQARDNQAVVRVWAVVYPPSFAPAADGSELVPENLPRIEFAAAEGEWYGGEYARFDEAGRYRLAIYAEDASGLRAGPRLVVIEVGDKLFLPLAAR